MAMYALALAPLVNDLHGLCNHVWYADDATGCGTFAQMRAWFDALLAKGPKYGYFPKPAKCILVVKPERAAKAQEMFKNTDVCVQTEGSKDSGVEVTVQGTRHLGAAIGTPDCKTTYVNKKIDGWCEDIRMLAKIAASQLHAAFSAFTLCMQSQWTILARSMPELAD